MTSARALDAESYSRAVSATSKAASTPSRYCSAVWRTAISGCTPVPSMASPFGANTRIVQNRTVAPVLGSSKVRGAPLPTPVGCPTKTTSGCSSLRQHARLSAAEKLSSLMSTASLPWNFGSPHLEPRPLFLNDPAEMADVVDVRFAGGDRRRLRETFFGRPTRATRCSEE